MLILIYLWSVNNQYLINNQPTNLSVSIILIFNQNYNLALTLIKLLLLYEPNHREHSGWEPRVVYKLFLGDMFGFRDSDSERVVPCTLLYAYSIMPCIILNSCCYQGDGNDRTTYRKPVIRLPSSEIFASSHSQCLSCVVFIWLVPQRLLCEHTPCLSPTWPLDIT